MQVSGSEYFRDSCIIGAIRFSICCPLRVRLTRRTRYSSRPCVYCFSEVVSNYAMITVRVPEVVCICFQH